MNEAPAARLVRANAAKQFKDNPLFGQMFDGVVAYLDAQALECDPDNKDKAQRIVISRQLLASMQREIERRIDDGEFAAFTMQEIEKAGRLRLFRR